MAVSILRGADGRVRPFWRFLIAMVLWLLAQLAAYQLVRPESIVSVTAGVYFTLVTAITLGTVTWMSRVLDRATGPLAYIGFPMEVPAARLVGVGFLCGAGLVTLAALVMAVGGSTSFRLQLNAETMSAALTQFIVFAIAALHEEVVFRGYPFQRLVESVGAVAAVVAYAVLFGLVHMANPNASALAAFNTAAVGALFGVAYLLTRSLWLVWGIHWGWNFMLAVVLGLNVSGFDTPGPVTGSVSGPVWLTGGAYGIEGGASGTIAIALGFAGLVWLVRRQLIVGPPAPPPSAYVAVPTPIIDDGGQPSSFSG